jgi:hypothetical protein
MPPYIYVLGHSLLLSENTRTTHNAHVFQSAKTPHCGTTCSVEKYINTSSSEHFSPLSLSANLKTDPRPKNEVVGWHESERQTRTIKESIRQSIQVEKKAWKKLCVE